MRNDYGNKPRKKLAGGKIARDAHKSYFLKEILWLGLD